MRAGANPLIYANAFDMQLPTCMYFCLFWCFSLILIALAVHSRLPKQQGLRRCSDSNNTPSRYIDFKKTVERLTSKCEQWEKSFDQQTSSTAKLEAKYMRLRQRFHEMTLLYRRLVLDSHLQKQVRNNCVWTLFIRVLIFSTCLDPIEGALEMVSNRGGNRRHSERFIRHRRLFRWCLHEWRKVVQHRGVAWQCRVIVVANSLVSRTTRIAAHHMSVYPREPVTNEPAVVECDFGT